MAEELLDADPKPTIKCDCGDSMRPVNITPVYQPSKILFILFHCINCHQWQVVGTTRYAKLRPVEPKPEPKPEPEPESKPKEEPKEDRLKSDGDERYL